MTSTAPSACAPLDTALADFIAAGQSMHVAAVNDPGQPTVVRALGCRVNEARTRVTVLVPRSQSAALLQAIDSNGRIAAVFSKPETNQSLQLKGEDATACAATEADRALVVQYVDRINERLAALQIPEIFVRTLCSCAPDDLVTITFSPSLAFQQTPGGSAGDSLPLGGAPL